MSCPGQSADLRWDVFLPPVAPRIDIALVFDSTGSMESLISTAQTRALEIESLLRALSPDLAIGVVDARDFGYGRAGLASDQPVTLRGPISSDPQDLVAATSELWAGGGGDAPEAYASAIEFALDSPQMAWREGAGPLHRYVRRTRSRAITT